MCQSEGEAQPSAWVVRILSDSTSIAFSQWMVVVSDWRGAPFGVSSLFPHAVPACGIHSVRGSFYGDAFFPDKSQEAE